MNGSYKLPKPRTEPLWRPTRNRRRELAEIDWGAARELAERAWRRRQREAIDHQPRPAGD